MKGANRRFYFASESVGEGHPDKLCDQIADAVLDECLKVDSKAVTGLNACTKGKLVRILLKLYDYRCVLWARQW